MGASQRYGTVLTSLISHDLSRLSNRSKHCNKETKVDQAFPINKYARLPLARTLNFDQLTSRSYSLIISRHAYCSSKDCFSIYEGGQTDLNVSNLRRQPITFHHRVSDKYLQASPLLPSAAASGSHNMDRRYQKRKLIKSPSSQSDPSYLSPSKVIGVYSFCSKRSTSTANQSIITSLFKNILQYLSYSNPKNYE